MTQTPPLTALASRTPNTETVVKAIKWGETSYGKPEATTVAGVYRINSGWSGGWSVTIKGKLLPTDDGRENHPTIDAAKAAAQADFNRRIMSALVETPK